MVMKILRIPSLFGYFSNPSNAIVPEPYAQVVLLNDDGAPPIDGSGFSTLTVIPVCPWFGKNNLMMIN